MDTLRQTQCRCLTDFHKRADSLGRVGSWFYPVMQHLFAAFVWWYKQLAGRVGISISQPARSGDMTILYQIDRQAGVTYVVWDGVVAAGQYLSHVKRLLADPEWPPARRLHLSDLRSTTLDSTIDRSVLEKAVGMFAAHPKISMVKTAIVAHEAFHQALLYERLISPIEPSVIVFHSLDTACMWLGIETKSAAHELNSLRARAREDGSP